MSRAITVYRRTPTQIRPIGGPMELYGELQPLGSLVFDPLRGTVCRYTPEGTLIDMQRESLWGQHGGESFDSWLRQHRDVWSLDLRDAYFDTDLTMDEGL